MSSPIERAARATTAPVRNFFNQHFESVKDEVRIGREVQLDVEQLRRIENTLVETSVYQAQLIARLRDELAIATERIGELERQTAIVARVVAASAAPGDEVDARRSSTPGVDSPAS